MATSFSVITNPGDNTLLNDSTNPEQHRHLWRGTKLPSGRYTISDVQEVDDGLIHFTFNATPQTGGTPTSCVSALYKNNAADSHLVQVYRDLIT